MLCYWWMDNILLINADILYYWCGGSVRDFQQRTQFQCRIVLCPKSGDFLFLCCGLWPNKDDQTSAALGTARQRQWTSRRPRQRRSWSLWLAISGLCSFHQTLEVELLTVTVTFFTAWCYNNTAAAHGLWQTKKPDLGDPAARLVSSGPWGRSWPEAVMPGRSSIFLYNFAHQSPNVHRFDSHVNSEHASTYIF